MDFNQAAIRLFKSDLPFGEAENCKERTLKNLLDDMGINDTPNKEEVNVKEN
jgi:sulfur carrier protein ThiS